MKNVRTGIMPPATEPRVPPDEMKTLPPLDTVVPTTTPPAET